MSKVARNRLTRISVMAFAIVVPASARGGYNLPEFFVANPHTNSADWTSAVAQAGGLVNSSVDFQAMSTGTLDSTFYAQGKHNVGVTLQASIGTFNQILNGPGPGQGNTSGPVSTGEGKAPAGNYLESDSPGAATGSSLTMTFSRPVMAVGLFTIDYFGIDPATNSLTLSVYGTDGALLGSATAVRENFQSNYLYFMGFVDTSAAIGEAVLTRSADNDGDKIGISSIRFADAPQVINAVPEPSSVALLALGAGGIALASGRRRRRAP